LEVLFSSFYMAKNYFIDIFKLIGACELSQYVEIGCKEFTGPRRAALLPSGQLCTDGADRLGVFTLSESGF
jgi:hypothetical protein